jgi:hypothetical protein
MRIGTLSHMIKLLKNAYGLNLDVLVKSRISPPLVGGEVFKTF